MRIGRPKVKHFFFFNYYFIVLILNYLILNFYSQLASVLKECPDGIGCLIEASGANSVVNHCFKLLRFFCLYLSNFNNVFYLFIFEFCLFLFVDFKTKNEEQHVFTKMLNFLLL